MNLRIPKFTSSSAYQRSVEFLAGLEWWQFWLIFAAIWVVSVVIAYMPLAK